MPKKLEYEYVKNYVESQGYTLISNNYINSKSKLEMICPEGHEYLSTFHNFKSNDARCKTCANITLSKNRRFSFNYVKKFFSNEGYTLLDGGYINGRKHLRVSCTKGHIYNVSFNNFKMGKRCWECEILRRSKRYRHSIVHVRSELSQAGYVLLSEKYVNARKKIEIKCPVGHVYYGTFGHFHSGKRCPQCREFSSERKVSEILGKWGIENIPQKTFPSCVNKKSLRFDFYIPIENTCIELQGKQHYEVVDFFGGEEGFKLRKINDNIKRRFCKKNNIRLVEIPYWDFDHIDEILKEELNF